MTVYAFDGFEVDAAQFELRANGVPVPMEPQVFRILLFLIEARDRLVTRDDLFETIWKGRIVSDTALSSRIKSVRKALGDDGANQRYVRTMRGEGFRFVGQVEQSAPVPVPVEPVTTTVSTVMSRPLVGVFPFSCDHAEAEYLVDGLAETLIAELAAWRWFPVRSRHASFAMGRAGGDLLQQARALNVRYAVCGSIASKDGKARLAIDLLDVPSGETLLTELFEDDLTSLLAVQPEIAARILHLIAPEVEGAERRRIVRAPPSDLSAWDLTLKALWALNRPSPDTLAHALKDIESSIRLDPGSAMPWSLKAQAYFEMGLNGWLVGNVTMARGCFTEMLDAARNSIDLDPRGWMGHSLASAGELFAAGAYVPARRHADEALRLNPSAGMAHHFSGCIVGFGGDPAEAIAIQELVYSVDPSYRHATVIEADLGLWRFLLGDYEQALAHLDTSLAHNPANQRALQRRVAVRSSLGDVAGARDDAAKLAQVGATPTREQVRASYPFQDSAHGDKLVEALFANAFAD